MLLLSQSPAFAAVERDEGEVTEEHLQGLQERFAALSKNLGGMPEAPKFSGTIQVPSMGKPADTQEQNEKKEEGITS